MRGRREEKRNSVSIKTVLTCRAHCGPLPTTVPASLPKPQGKKAFPWQVLAPCYAVRTVPARLPSWTGYQRVQLVLQLLVGPLGSCVAVLQPVEEYKADPWVKVLFFRPCSTSPS